MFSRNFLKKPLKEKYSHIKTIHGEIHQFSIRLQNAVTLKKDLERTDQFIACARNCMYAAKSIRDALQDIEQLQNSSNDTKYNFYLAIREKVILFVSQIQKLMEQQDTEKNAEALITIFKETQRGYTVSVQELYKEGVAKSVNQVEISTLINFNREMYTAFKSFLFAVKDYLLTPEKAEYFEDLPGFIR
jgi:phosphate:Na+ symporter